MWNPWHSEYYLQLRPIINQIDMKTAFFYKFIDQLVYLQKPKSSETSARKNMVCKLLKVLYGLKQAHRLWYKKFSNFFLKKLGLQQINANHSIFVSIAGINGQTVSTFINNIKIMGANNFRVIDRVKQKLTAAFKMADMGSISFYLYFKVSRDCEKKIIKFLQLAYIHKILAKSHPS